MVGASQEGTMQPLDPAFPPWVQVASALGPVFTASATLIVGVVVAFIAYRQWRVAHEKLLLDLFDKRFAVYTEATTAVRDFFKAPPPEPLFGTRPVTGLSDQHMAQTACIAILHDVGRRARFLFGDEVAERIKVTRDALIDTLWEGTPENYTPEEQEERKRVRARAYKEADRFRDEFGLLVMKYMRITRAL
jgi:hypothetical protein